MFASTVKDGIIAELLVVVAIIDVLVAISIPIFTSQLEKARETTDAANIRAAYAEVAADALDEATLATAKTGITVDLKQQTDGWGTTPDIGGIAADISGTPKKDGTCQVKWDDTKNVITLTYSAVYAVFLRFFFYFEVVSLGLLPPGYNFAIFYVKGGAVF